MKPPFAIALALLLALPVAAGAFSREYTYDRITCTVMAPDWCWQGQNVNVMVTCRNPSTSNREPFTAVAIFRMELPADGRLTYDGPEERQMEVYPAETKRLAFTGIHVPLEGPRGKVPISLGWRIELPDQTYVDGTVIHVRTTRGAMIREASWTIYALALLTAGWAFAVGAVLRRRARPGAWKAVPPELLLIEAAKDELITRKPKAEGVEVGEDDRAPEEPDGEGDDESA